MISAARSTAAVSVEKKGQPVPAPKMTTRPFSRCRMADINTGSSYFEIDQLKPSDYIAIRNLKEGEISEPVESMDNEGRGAMDRNSGNTVYKIIRLDRIIPSHTADFEKDYNVLFERVQSLKQSEAIDNFLEKKISESNLH